MPRHPRYLFFFFFNDTAPTEIYTLPLHDALPICERTFARRPHPRAAQRGQLPAPPLGPLVARAGGIDRKSTRLNSSHSQISYAVFCLKKKKKKKRNTLTEILVVVIIIFQSPPLHD